MDKPVGPEVAQYRPTLLLAVGVGVAYTLFAALYVTAVLNLRTPAAERGLGVWAQEPRGPDAADYDNIGLCIARGKGFATDCADAEFRKPYDEAFAEGYMYWAKVLERKSPVTPTAYRPPLYPALLAGAYVVFGRNFVLLKVLNCLFLGVMAALVFLMGTRLSRSAAAGFAAVGMLATNPALWSCARWTSTEPLCLVLLAGAMYALIVAIERPRACRFATAGLFLAAGVLTRSALVFCVPFFLIPIWLQRSASVRARLRNTIVYVAVLAVPLVIWSARNTLVAGHVVLLSTQGNIALPSGYTEVCLKNGGEWVSKQPYDEEMKAAGSEWAQDLKGKEIFRRLIRQNWRLVPRLVVMKIWAMIPVPYKLRSPGDGSLALPYDLAYAAIFLLAAFGVVGIGDRILRWTALAPVLGIFLCCAVTFACTRFRLTMLPGLAVLAGAGLLYIWRRVMGGRGRQQQGFADESRCGE